MKELSITKNSKLFALLLNIYNPKENFDIAKNYYKSETPSDLINSAQNTQCDILALKFNIKNEQEIEQATILLKSLLPQIAKPLMIYGTGDDSLDKKLLPELTKNLDRTNCIIANLNENTYTAILPAIIEGGHYAVLKTPIDINLAKELNILTSEMGLPTEKIIMDTDIGGLGYGYEYGFSITEKIIIEANKDKYLNLPLLSDASSEALKTKEAKSDDFSTSWGEIHSRARMIELSACSGIITAGANIITINCPENLPLLKGMVI